MSGKKSAVVSLAVKSDFIRQYLESSETPTFKDLQICWTNQGYSDKLPSALFYQIKNRKEQPIKARVEPRRVLSSVTLLEAIAVRDQIKTDFGSIRRGLELLEKTTPLLERYGLEVLRDTCAMLSPPGPSKKKKEKG